MKIVFVLPDMPGGGTERVVALLANEYVQMGYEVDILLFAGKQVAYELDKNVKVIFLGKKSSGNWSVRIKRMFKMRQYFKANKDCKVFSFNDMGTVFTVLTAWGIPHKLLVSERSDPTRGENQRIRNWAYEKADVFVVQTEETEKYFSQGIRRKSIVIPNPVREGLPEPYEGIRRKRIVAVGRLNVAKNHKLLINAFSEFVKKQSEYELHIFGVGELEGELREQVKQLALEHKVIFRGFMKNIEQEIHDASMFVLSSDYEGISNAMVEALAMGIPVIATDCPVGGAATYIEDGVNGILIPVGDKEALISAMEKIADNAEWANSLGRNGVKIKEKYSLSQIACCFLEAVKSD